MIERVCQCGQTFVARQANQTSFKEGHHASLRTEFKKGCMPHNTGKHWPANVKEKISRARRGQTPKDETKRKLSLIKLGENNPFYNKHHTAKTKAEIRKKILTLWQNQKYRERISQAFSQARLKQWQNPQYVINQVALIKASGKMKPNKAEQQLTYILSRNIPAFSYNGDFSLGISLGGLIPDFVNTNGKKEIIELFGKYWHSGKFIEKNWRRSELGRVMIYNSLGWRCLVIWESDLKKLTEEEIVTKIKTYFGREHVISATA